MKQKTSLKQFSAYELIEKALEAAEKDVLSPGKFKAYFRVEFTFNQLIGYLKRKRIWGKLVLSEQEYDIIQANKNKKETLISVLKDVKIKNTRTIWDDIDI